MTDTVEVTAADRDAAAELCLANLIAQHGSQVSWMSEAVQALRDGHHDDHPYVQAFARHRHEATRELVEGTQRAAQIIERNLYRQSEKIEDAKVILNDLVAKHRGEG